MQKLIISLGAVLCLGASAAVNAAPITVIAEGVTSELSDPDGLLPLANPGLGSPWLMTFTYDSDTPDQLLNLPFLPPQFSQLGDYDNPFLDFRLSIGGQTFGLFEESFIQVANDLGCTVCGNEVFDSWSASTRRVTPFGPPNPVTDLQDAFLEETIALTLNTSGPTEQPPAILQDDSLVLPPPLAEWDVVQMDYVIFERRSGSCPPNESCTERTELARTSAIVTSLTVVPLPAAFWLLGSALLGLGWFPRGAKRFASSRGVSCA